tara:strand:- start:6652 stop:6990 length:339 start_codon:yes stop_codon:yes gene_type:complete
MKVFVLGGTYLGGATVRRYPLRGVSGCVVRNWPDAVVAVARTTIAKTDFINKRTLINSGLSMTECQIIASRKEVGGGGLSLRVRGLANPEVFMSPTDAENRGQIQFRILKGS